MLSGLIITSIISLPITALERSNQYASNMKSDSYKRPFNQDTFLSLEPKQFHPTDNDNCEFSRFLDCSKRQTKDSSSESVSIQLPETQKPDLTLRLGLSKGVASQATLLCPISQFNRYTDTSHVGLRDPSNGFAENNCGFKPYQMHRVHHGEVLDTQKTTDSSGSFPSLELNLGCPNLLLGKSFGPRQKDQDILSLTLGHFHPAESGIHVKPTPRVASYHKNKTKPIHFHEKKKTNDHHNTDSIYVAEKGIFEALQSARKKRPGETPTEDLKNPLSCARDNVLGSSKQTQKAQELSVLGSDKGVKSHQEVESGVHRKKNILLVFYR